MKIMLLQAISAASLTGVFIHIVPDAPHQKDDVLFESPVRIKAGDAYLGQNRLYPSPIIHDIDNDKQPDIVIGDLFGKLTYAPRNSQSQGGGLYDGEKPLKDRSDEQLKFHNW